MFTLRYVPGYPNTLADVRYNHAQTARRSAATFASAAGHAVEVLRNDKVAYIMRPNGTVQPPEGAIQPPRMNCTRGSGRPCFCQPCRDDRKATR